MVSKKQQARFNNHSAWVATYAASQYLKLAAQYLTVLKEAAPVLLIRSAAVMTCAGGSVYLFANALTAGWAILSNQYATNPEPLKPALIHGLTFLTDLIITGIAMVKLDHILENNRPTITRAFATLSRRLGQCQDNISAYREDRAAEARCWKAARRDRRLGSSLDQLSREIIIKKTIS